MDRNRKPMTVQESPKDNIETTVNMHAFDRENNSLRSIAISLKRIADVMEGDRSCRDYILLCKMLRITTRKGCDNQ